ncbi:MAG TPA: ferredoxin reductase family protein [Acidimicrobiales bacterium]|nr:ferredoxin reductase family protein [Acidimicrobiales bacterium]
MTGGRSTQEQREAAVLAVIAAAGLAVIGLWFANNPGRGLHSLGDRLTAAGRITGLLGTYLVLVQVVLMARLPWLDHWIGTDRLAAWHRANGQYTILLLVGHTALITWGYAAQDHVALAKEAATLLHHYPDVLAATAALGLLILVAVTSIRRARRRLRYETWYFIHLYTYIAIALSFSHQLATGNEFITHPANRFLWAAMYVATFGLLVVYRVGVPIRDAFRYQLRVAAIEPESRDAVSVYVTGRHLDRMRAEAGQFFRWRFLERSTWWEAHPFSLSAAPSGQSLRITAKGVGDHSAALRDIRPGTRVMAEGPYGNLTAERRTRRRVLLIAGGVGITPLRALLESLPAGPGDLTLLYRARTEQDLLFRRELDQLAQARGFVVRYLLGRRDKRPNPLSASHLRQHVPDIAQRDVYLCGPPKMMDVAVDSLRALGVSRGQIHRERFEL